MVLVCDCDPYPLQSSLLCQINKLFEGFKWFCSFFHIDLFSPFIPLPFSWFAFLSCLSISFSKLFFMMLLWPLHGLNNLISTNLFRDTKIYSFCVVMVSIIHSSCMLSFIHIYTKTQASKSTCSKFVFLECPQFVVNCTPCLFPSFWNPVLIDKPSSKVRVYYIHHLYSYSCIYPMQSRRLIPLPSSIL